MDDLSGLEWSSKQANTQSKPPPMNSPYSSFRASPSPFASGRNTPISAQPSSSSANQAAPAKPAQDSFSNLVKFSSGKTAQNLSLAERQAQLEAEKRKKEDEKRKQTEAQFGNGQFWDTLGSRGASPSPALQSPPPSNGTRNDDSDLFAAFNKDTRVDKSSHYPPPESNRSTPANANALDLSNPNAWGSSLGNGTSATADLPSTSFNDDDDPFGLNEIQPKTSGRAAPPPTAEADDDFLGDLGRPVEEIRSKQKAVEPQPQPGKPIDVEEDSSSADEPPKPKQRPMERRPKPKKDDFDDAVTQLVDYGFTVEDARRGLTESGEGINVQAAANWLLDDAHRKSKAKSQGRSSSAASSQADRRNNRSPASGEPDLAKTAASMGNSLFKTANSLWKTGQKRVQQAVSDFNQEGDPSQPKWMREAQQQQGQSKDAGRAPKDVTDEALMLEAGGRPQPPRTQSQQSTGSRANQGSSRGATPPQPSSSRNSPAPRWQQQPPPPSQFDAKAKLSRMAADDDLSSYSSPNRRRRQQPQPQAQLQQAERKPAEPSADLLFNSEAPKPSPARAQQPARAPVPQARRPPQSKPASPAPPRPARQIPHISPDALQTSTKYRLAGSAHFKRGDYASAHAAYSTSLSAVPNTHPLAILILTNRSLTALKTGEPKQAVQDAEQALELIGPGKGQGETVAVKTESGQDETRDLKDIYGKALSRKAEALEQMEKWSDAGNVWQLCVEAGVGGATAIKGRQRCQNALAPKPKAAPKPAAKPRPRPSATADLGPQKSSEAVNRLREANQAAAKEDDEKFALSEAVDARISAWRDGKRENLRALLGSLDSVLWPDSGWKKVGMHELVMANKVKIAYMKAIAKTHPDKVSCGTLYLSRMNVIADGC
jgi:tetratricopeptide (TPR) repeat protein